MLCDCQSDRGKVVCVSTCISIVAFSDAEGNSIAYKKFVDDAEGAITFYRKQLGNRDVNVISTRKTQVPCEERPAEEQKTL